MFDGPILNQHPDPFLVVIVTVILFALTAIPFCGLLYLAYAVLTLPMRRKERARLFLHLLEMGLGEGRSPEAAIESAASTGDKVLGRRFDNLAQHLRQGVRLGQALDLTPGLLPARVVAMLKVGERIGDVRKVLPACQHLLRDGVSQVRGAMNYLVLLAFVFTPATAVIPIILRIKVIPALKQVFEGMSENSDLPAFSRFVLGQGGVFTLIQLAIILGLWLALVLYACQPAVGRALRKLFGARKWMSPWAWKRTQRDFSAMLAVLLDSGVPEAEAVRMAGEATAEPLMQQRAEAACRKLESGVPLPKVLEDLDKSGELPWRVRNALQHGKGFLQALTGWHGALDAKAFQMEQSAAQIITSVLVLINGAVVACIVIGVFLALIRIINDAALW